MSELVAMTSSSPPSTKISCFNSECRDAQAHHYHHHQQFRKGWRLRNGCFAPLCLRCAAAFEEGKFCNTFHLDAPGWRNCESCGKRIHCGCIVSVHAYILLDAGGVDCVSCVRKQISMAPNQIWPPFSSSLTVPDRLKDLSAKNLHQVAGPSAISGNWGNVVNIWNTSAVQSDLNPRMQYDVDRVKQMEKKKLEDSFDRANSANLALMDSLKNMNAAVDFATRTHSLHRNEMSLNGLQGKTCEVHPNARVNFSLRSSSSKEDLSNPHRAAVPYPSSSEANDLNRSFVTQSQQQTLSPQIANQINAMSQNGMDSSGETEKHTGRPPADARGRGHLLPRNLPKITDQELKQISGDSNSVITPLFEKMLSASDAGRVGRLVLPKKCAEAYFPTITHSEGLPLEVRDAKGKEWLLHFRYWPNNNSRMYVLEGVTPFIQSMQLQAGDTVTFSRIDPEGKLVIGFRKVASVPPSNQDKQSLNTGSDVSKSSEVNNADPASGSPRIYKSGYKSKDVVGYEASIPRKRNCRNPDAKSKCVRMDHKDTIELKLTRGQAHDMLRPPPNHDPIVMVVEGHAFEEYEDAPIHGKPLIITTDQVGSSCSPVEEVTSKQLEDIVSSSKTAGASKKIKPAGEDMDVDHVLEGISTPVNLAMLEEDDALPCSTQTTSRHPHHRPGCRCIVCIQPISGTRTKHQDTCNCNVCLIMKRRKLSQIKYMSWRETNSGRKSLEHLQLPDPQPEHDPCLIISADPQSSDDDPDKKPLSLSIDQIYLNIHPERPDALSPTLHSSSMVRLLSGNHKLHPILNGATSLSCVEDQVSNEKDSCEGDQGGSDIQHAYPPPGITNEAPDSFRVTKSAFVPATS